MMKYKGMYRLRPVLDTETNDFPRDARGDIDETYDDIYIDCRDGGKIFYYGKRQLMAYIPSTRRGRHIIRELDKQSITYTNYFEGDEEVTFRFKASDIEVVADLMSAKIGGANINPFSTKNLPKSNVQIPSEKIEAYKATIAPLLQGDILILNRFTNDFLSTNLQRKLKKNDRLFNYKSDMKKLKMSRQTKEYIYTKGMFDDYLSYLDRKIKAHYKNKAANQ